MLDLGRGASVFTVYPGWGEQVLRDPLRWVQELESPLFARVRDEERNDKVKALHYSFPVGVCFAKGLTEPLPPGLYQSILISLAEAAAICLAAGRPLCAYADAQALYITGNGAPQFAYVPIEKKKLNKRCGLKAMLKLLTKGKVRFVNAAEEDLKKAVKQYLKSRKTVDCISYALFLRDVLGLKLQDSTAKAVKNVSPQASAQTIARKPETEVYRFEAQGNNGGNAPKTDVSVQVSINHYDYDVPGSSNGYSDADDVYTVPLMSMLAIRRESTGEVMTVPPGGGSIGRSASCMMRVEGNSKIGREHAYVKLDGGYIVIRDNQSTNGTRANGKGLIGNEEARLGVDETFSLANEEFRVVRANSFSTDQSFRTERG